MDWYRVSVAGATGFLMSPSCFFGSFSSRNEIEEYLQKTFPKGCYQRASHVRENYQHIIVDVKFDGSKFRLRAGGPVYRQPLLGFNGPNGKVELLVPKLSRGFGCYLIDFLDSPGPDDTIPIKVRCVRTVSDTHWKFSVSGQFPKDTNAKDYAKQLTLDALDGVLERSIENLAKAHAALQQMKDK